MENEIVEEVVLEETEQPVEQEVEQETEDQAVEQATDQPEEGEQTEPEIEEPAPQKAPAWITELRRQNRELKRQLQSVQAPATVPQLGEEPTLEGCDFDSEVFKKKFREYMEKSLAIESHRREQAQHEERLQQTWQQKVSGYEAKKSAFRAAEPDFDDAEEVCKDVLSNVQQVIIVKNARDPVRLVREIGRNPELAAKLGGITDPVEFTYEIATMEAKMATKSPAGKTAPAPDKALRSGGGVSNGLSGNAKIAELKEKAHKTGDWDSYFTAKRAAKK
jgi:hypothetical protein